MSIDPNTLPDGTVVETSIGLLCFKDGEGWQDFRHLLGGDTPWLWRARTIARAYVPVPEGMTYADAEAALADAGAWDEVQDWGVVPDGARLRNEWVRGRAGDRTYVHRDDLPPTDPDAELVKKMARALYPAYEGTEHLGDAWENVARAALAVVREHEARS